MHSGKPDKSRIIFMNSFFKKRDVTKNLGGFSMQTGCERCNVLLFFTVENLRPSQKVRNTLLHFICCRYLGVLLFWFVWASGGGRE